MKKGKNFLKKEYRALKKGKFFLDKEKWNDTPLR